jgi:hypothetical protein
MTFADLLRETIDLPEQQIRENERTRVGVRGAASLNGIVTAGGRRCLGRIRD